jgi:hypothetical protein
MDDHGTANAGAAATLRLFVASKDRRRPVSTRPVTTPTRASRARCAAPSLTENCARGSRRQRPPDSPCDGSRAWCSYSSGTRIVSRRAPVCNTRSRGNGVSVTGRRVEASGSKPLDELAARGSQGRSPMDRGERAGRGPRTLIAPTSSPATHSGTPVLTMSGGHHVMTSPLADGHPQAAPGCF